MTIESIIISRVIPSLSQICNKFSAVAELITIIHDLQDRKIRHVWIRWVGIETTKFHRSKYQRKTELTRRDAITSNHSTNLRVSSSRFDQNTSFRFTTTIVVEKYNSGMEIHVNWFEEYYYIYICIYRIFRKRHSERKMAPLIIRRALARFTFFLFLHSFFFPLARLFSFLPPPSSSCTGDGSCSD